MGLPEIGMIAAGVIVTLALVGGLGWAGRVLKGRKATPPPAKS